MFDFLCPVEVLFGNVESPVLLVLIPEAVVTVAVVFGFLSAAAVSEQRSGVPSLVNFLSCAYG